MALRIASAADTVLNFEDREGEIYITATKGDKTVDVAYFSLNGELETLSVDEDDQAPFIDDLSFSDGGYLNVS